MPVISGDHAPACPHARPWTLYEIDQRKQKARQAERDDHSPNEPVTQSASEGGSLLAGDVALESQALAVRTTVKTGTSRLCRRCYQRVGAVVDNALDSKMKDEVEKQFDVSQKSKKRSFILRARSRSARANFWRPGVSSGH